MRRHRGKVTWFSSSSGYGFLRCSHAADVFVDSSAIEEQSRFLLRKGDRVQFDIVESDVGLEARTVVRVADQIASPSSFSGRFNDGSLVEGALAKLIPSKLQTVLLIEADEELRAVRREFLNAAGYLVAACDNVEVAADVYRSNLPIDLVLMRLFPPKGTGPCVHELHFLKVNLPVLLSAPALPIDLWPAMQNRNWHFLPMASSLPTLLSTVRTLLRLAHREAA